jgi:hypothetical protein
MSSTIHGIGLNELKPTHDLEVSRNSDGGWSASLSFHCRFTDHANVAITDKLQQGTKITDLDATIPILYEFISLSGHKVKHQRGGITKISCTFSGSSENDGFGGGASDRSQSYSFRGTIGQRSILLHPNYIAEVTDDAELQAVAALWFGEAVKAPDEYEILRKTDDYNYGAEVITALDTIKWIDKILKGIRTYDARMIEWTVATTNKAGMTATDLNNFGKEDETPPGDPPKPSGWPTAGWWHFSDIGEDRDDNSSSYTRTYTLRPEPIDEDLYDY